MGFMLTAIPLLSLNTPCMAQNPYLPLWEHVPDGEPRVFEDPDNPGKYRAYIIGSHDTSFQWRDEGAIFSYHINNQWDTMFAPDLVEIKRKDGTKDYYLYPHSRGHKRVRMVCKGKRPDGPFTPTNLNADGCLVASSTSTLPYTSRISLTQKIQITTQDSEHTDTGDSNIHQPHKLTLAPCTHSDQVLSSSSTRCQLATHKATTLREQPTLSSRDRSLQISTSSRHHPSEK